MQGPVICRTTSNVYPPHKYGDANCLWRSLFALEWLPYVWGGVESFATLPFLNKASYDLRIVMPLFVLALHSGGVFYLLIFTYLSLSRRDVNNDAPAAVGFTRALMSWAHALLHRPSIMYSKLTVIKELPNLYILPVPFQMDVVINHTNFV